MCSVLCIQVPEYLGVGFYYFTHFKDEHRKAERSQLKSLLTSCPISQCDLHLQRHRVKGCKVMDLTLELKRNKLHFRKAGLFVGICDRLIFIL